MYMWLNDLIPFCEWFLIPYVFWYVLTVITLGYFLLYDVDSLKRLQVFFITIQLVAIAICIIFPSSDLDLPCYHVYQAALDRGFLCGAAGVAAGRENCL